MTTTTIQKWGNSYAVRLPKGTIDTLKLKEGQTISIEAHTDGRSLSLTPTTPMNRTLTEMLAQVLPEDIHSETGWGTAVGKEIW
jgi:antitoxin MazE